MDSYEPPDLTSVLRTLSSYLPRTGVQSSKPVPEHVPRRPSLNQSHHVSQSAKSQIPSIEHGLSEEYNPNDPRLMKKPTLNPWPPPNVFEESKVAQKSSSLDANSPSIYHEVIKSDPNIVEAHLKSSNEAIDPSSIIEWPAGLRYITKAAAQDSRICNTIKKMIASQHDHEKQWWAGRETLIQKQKDRIEGKRKLEDVLRAVGGHIPTGMTIPNDSVELSQYDVKVHRALEEMVSAMSAELKALNIPFFCTSPSLVDHMAKTSDEKDRDAAYKGTITQLKLIELQKRMLEFLEDMYKA